MITRRCKATTTDKSVSLQSISDKFARGEIPEILIVLRVDCSGSGRALKDMLEVLSYGQKHVRVIFFGVGDIGQEDVLLAKQNGAIIIGFHVRPLPDAQQLADTEGIEIRTYRIIYAAIDDVRTALLGQLESTSQ